MTGADADQTLQIARDRGHPHHGHDGLVRRLIYWLSSAEMLPEDRDIWELSRVSDKIVKFSP